jgi:acetyl-CoA carboxylase biotin carboxyl carrier protein
MEDRERFALSNGARGYDMRARLSTTDLRDLIELMRDYELEEITIAHEAGGLRLTLRKPAPAMAPAPALAVAPAEIAPVEIVEVEDVEDVEERLGEWAGERGPQEKMIPVRAPLVGIFRSNMKPDGKAAVGLNDIIRLGQVVGAIEALNVPNDVEAEVAGRVTKICVEDGEPVEYGQTLLEVEPLATALSTSSASSASS